MKKIFVLFAFLAISFFNAEAQLTALVEQSPICDYNVRPTNIAYWEYGGDEYGVYHTGENETEWFKLVKFSNFYSGTPVSPYGYTELKKIPVHNDVTIVDIAVYHDYAVFCGWIKNGPGIYDTEGIIGVFDLTIMAAGGIPQIHYERITGSYRIDKVIAYKRLLYEKIVAIGEEAFPGYSLPNRSYFILEADFDMSSANPNPPLSNAQKRGLFISYPYLETPSEILLTDNYLVIVGYATKFDALTIRRCDPDNVLSTVAMFQDMYYYPSVSHDVLSHTHSTIHVSYDDYINISYLTNSFGSYFSTCIRTVDLRTMQIVASQEMPLNNKSEPMDLIYMPTYKHLVLMQNMPFPTTTDSVTSCFVKVDPFAFSNYMSDVIYLDDDIYGTVTRNETTGSEALAVSKDDRLFVFRADYGLTFSTPNCPRKNSIAIRVIDNATINIFVWPDVLSNVPCSSTPDTQIPLNVLNSTICESH